MKVVEKIIKYEDYNYVEGSLQFNAHGHKTQQLLHSEYFSIDDISKVQMHVIQKHIPPSVPVGINRNKVSTLSLPQAITTIVDGDFDKPYEVVYDEIIIDDSCVDKNQNIKGIRFNSTKVGSELSSTVVLKAYGLIKMEREYKELETQFEIFTINHGPGAIELFPKKESYQTGEKVRVIAHPKSDSFFLGFKNEFHNRSKEFGFFVGKEDVTIEATFIDLETANSILSSGERKKYSNEKIEKITQEISQKNTTKKHSISDRIKTEWKRTSIKNNKLGVDVNGMWEIFSFIIGWGFCFFVCILLIYILGEGIFYLGLAILGVWLLNLVWHLLFSWRFFRWIMGTLFAWCLFSGILDLTSSLSATTKESSEFDKPPFIPKEEIKENSTIDYTHHLNWKDYDSIPYEANLIINSDLVLKAKLFRESYPNINSEQSYHNLLRSLYDLSIKDDYYLVFNELDSIRRARSLGKEHFMEVIVSMVQSIPYYAIVEESCNPYSYRDPAIRELLFQSPCEPLVKHGIKTPAEFLQDLKGDCDSRTLFLFGLLKSFGYDVAIFGSQKYKHSLLGVVLQSDRPHYKILNTKRYYLWEVTGKNFTPGLLPKEISNLNFWNINLN